MRKHTSTEQTAVKQIQLALVSRGYRILAEYPIHNPHTRSFYLYSNGLNVFILQEYRDGGCELYTPVSDNLSVQATIDQIPVRKE